jgi:methylated-DNA-protein-cysteine methyltransferase related protein
MTSIKQKILDCVRSIPDGKVVYFGQIAKVVGTSAQVVGYVLSGLNAKECEGLPWYRVVAKNGFVSSLKLGAKGTIQIEKLLQEGYEMHGEYVQMQNHLWDMQTDVSRDDLFG